MSSGQEKPAKTESLEQARNLLTEVVKGLGERDTTLTWQMLRVLHRKAQLGTRLVHETAVATYHEKTGKVGIGELPPA